jgi:GAF domain-containing protein
LETNRPKETGVNNLPKPILPSQRSLLSRIGWALTGHHAAIQDIGARRQARLSAALSLGYAVLTLISLPASLIISRKLIAAELALIPVIVVVLVAYILTRTKYYFIGAWGLVIAVAASAFLMIRNGANINITLLVSAALAFLIAGAILSYRSLILFVIANSILSPVLLYLISPGIGISKLGELGGYLITIGVLNIIVVASRNNLERQRLEKLQTTNRELNDTRVSLEKRVEERTSELAATSDESRKRAAQLAAISEVSRAITQLQNINDLLPAVTELISQRFGFYHVGIYLLDENRKNAVLRAASSEDGKRMMERGHRLPVGQTSIVGYVAAQGESRISLASGTDAFYSENPDLPSTKSEMALPLLAGQQVIGVLDIHSELPSAFRPQDVRIMSTLADQVAIAIENVRLFSETRQALADSQTAYRQSLKQEWARVTAESERIGYRYSAEGTLPLFDAASSREVESALDTGETIESESGIHSIAVPVKLRDETIGVLNIRASNPERKWNENELAIVQAIVERVGLALENARLLSDASRRAERERAISDITSKIGAASQLDLILQTAVEELGQIYEDSEIVLQIGGKSIKAR